MIGAFKQTFLGASGAGGEDLWVAYFKNDQDTSRTSGNGLQVKVGGDDRVIYGGSLEISSDQRAALTEIGDLAATSNQKTYKIEGYSSSFDSARIKDWDSDSSSNNYAAFDFLERNPETGANLQATLLCKFNSSWVRQWNTKGIAGPTNGHYGTIYKASLKLDSSGNIYMFMVDTGNSYGNSSAGISYQRVTQITKFNSSGTWQWAKKWFSETTSPAVVQVDGRGFGILANGNGYVVGRGSRYTGHSLAFIGIGDFSSNTAEIGSTNFVDPFSGTVQGQASYYAADNDGNTIHAIGRLDASSNYYLTIDKWDGTANPTGGPTSSYRSLVGGGGTTDLTLVPSGTYVDSSGNTYIAGIAKDGTSSIYHGFVGKWNSSNVEQWVLKVSLTDNGGAGTARSLDIADYNGQSLEYKDEFLYFSFEASGISPDYSFLMKIKDDGTTTGTANVTGGGITGGYSFVVSDFSSHFGAMASYSANTGNDPLYSGSNVAGNITFGTYTWSAPTNNETAITSDVLTSGSARI